MNYMDGANLQFDVNYIIPKVLLRFITGKASSRGREVTSAEGAASSATKPDDV